MAKKKTPKKGETKKPTPVPAPKSRVEDALESVRDAISLESGGMTPGEYTQFFEELLGDAESWRMDLDERAAELGEQDPQHG